MDKIELVNVANYVVAIDVDDYYIKNYCKEYNVAQALADRVIPTEVEVKVWAGSNIEVTQFFYDGKKISQELQELGKHYSRSNVPYYELKDVIPQLIVELNDESYLIKAEEAGIMSNHTHYYHCSSPDHSGVVHGSCGCGTARDFRPQAPQFLDKNKGASHQGALRHRAEVAAEIREIERSLLMKGW